MLISDLRADLQAPSLPVAVADTGNGHAYNHARQGLVAEQPADLHLAAVVHETARRASRHGLSLAACGHR